MAFPTSFTSNTALAAAGDLHKLKFTGVHVGKSIEFLAFLDTFTQSFTSTWNSEQVYGRNDPIGTFQGTQRTLNLAWTVPAGNVTEAKQNLERFSSLAQLLYPSYSEGGTPVAKGSKETPTENKTLYTSNALTLSKAPLIRIKFANLIDDAGGTQDGLLGWIGSFSWNPVIDMGMFEHGDGLYPKVVSLTVDFTVLHEHDLGWLPEGSPGGFGDKATFPFGG